MHTPNISNPVTTFSNKDWMVQPTLGEWYDQPKVPFRNVPNIPQKSLEVMLNALQKSALRTHQNLHIETPKTENSIRIVVILE